MAKLIFLLDGNVIKEYALDKARMTIGRRASNDIYIDNLAISGEHAVLVTISEDTYLEDLNSTNGTLINKNPVKKQTLKHGDEIGLGKYKLKYLKEGVVSISQPNGFSDTVLIESESTAVKESDASEDVETASNQAPEIPEALSQSKPDQDDIEEQNALEEVKDVPEEQPADEQVASNLKDGEPRLQILDGENAGGVLLLDKSMVKVGTPGVQVAVVTKRQEGYFITHVAGDNHPIVNGEQIGAQAVALSNHDEIEVLGTKMEFCLD